MDTTDHEFHGCDRIFTTKSWYCNIYMLRSVMMGIWALRLNCSKYIASETVLVECVLVGGLLLLRQSVRLDQPRVSTLPTTDTWPGRVSAHLNWIPTSISSHQSHYWCGWWLCWCYLWLPALCWLTVSIWVGQTWVNCPLSCYTITNNASHFFS